MTKQVKNRITVSKSKKASKDKGQAVLHKIGMGKSKKTSKKRILPSDE